jgi:hypothetical protein
MRLMRNFATVAFLFVTAVSSSPAKAGADILQTFAMLAKGDLVWGALEQTSIGGQPLYWRTFESPEKLLVVASGLSEFAGVFQRALMIQGKVLLSGVVRGQHWVAELTPADDGVRGVVSMLYLVAPVAQGALSSDLAWLDDLAQLHFSHAERGVGQATTQRIYSSTRSAASFMSELQQQFSGRGWTRTGRPGPDGFSHWQRGQQSVATFTHQVGDRTTLLIHWTAAEPPGQKD